MPAAMPGILPRSICFALLLGATISAGGCASPSGVKADNDRITMVVDANIEADGTQDSALRILVSGVVSYDVLRLPGVQVVTHDRSVTTTLLAFNGIDVSARPDRACDKRLEGAALIVTECDIECRERGRQMSRMARADKRR